MSARWWKGNLHTHTDLSDGDSPPDLVARWYDDAGYDFLAISDHNIRFDPSDLQADLSRRGSDVADVGGGGAYQLVARLGPGPRSARERIRGRNQLGAGEGVSVPAVLQSMIDRVHEDGGWASVNHPNFWSSISVDDLLALAPPRLRRGLQWSPAYLLRRLRPPPVDG